MTRIPRPKPLTYASHEFNGPKVDKQPDCVTIHVPPLSLLDAFVRMCVWCILAAGLGALIVTRMLGMELPTALDNTVKISAFYAIIMPLPLAMLIFCFYAYVIVRLACFGRRPSIIAIEPSGIYLDNPTAIIPRSRIPLDRFLEVTTAKRGAGLPRLTQAVRIALRQ